MKSHRWVLLLSCFLLPVSAVWAQSEPGKSDSSKNGDARSESKQTEVERTDKTDTRAQDSTPEKTGARTAAARTSQTGRVPLGVTVLSDAPGLPAGARLAPGGTIVLSSGDAITTASTPEGITVLGETDPPADPNRPLVRVTSSMSPEEQLQLAPIPKAPPEAIPPAPDAPDAPEAAGSQRERKLVGPSLNEQVAVFGGELKTGGQPLIDRIGWEPTDSLEPRDPANPYPWNPAQWSTFTIDPTWKPSEAYPSRNEANPYPWNPAVWSAPTFDPTWRPVDSWGRATVISGFVNSPAVAPAEPVPAEPNADTPLPAGEDAAPDQPAEAAAGTSPSPES